MHDDRILAQALLWDREDEFKKRKLIREAERARAAERSQGQAPSKALEAQLQEHPGRIRHSA